MILFRYVISQYFRFVGATVCLALFLFVLFDFIHKTTNYFAKYNPSGELILQFYLAQLPFQSIQALPIASLLSSVVVMVMLNRGNEVTAMRAAGMSPLHVALPLAAGGLILSGLGFIIGEFIVPHSSKRMHYVRKVLIEGRAQAHNYKQSHWIKNDGKILYFGHYNTTTQTLDEVKLIDLSEDFRPVRALQASRARYIPAYDYWELEQCYEIHLTQDGAVRSTKAMGRVTMFLPIEPHKLKNDLRLPDEISMRELSEQIDRGRKYGENVLALRIAWHVKLAYALAAFVISLIGVQFGYRSERTTETVRSVILAFGFGISYWFILSASRALASAGSLHPLPAAWAANCIILLIIGLQLWRVSAY